MRKISAIICLSPLIVGCSEDDSVNDDPINEVEPLVLECQAITEDTVLEDRGAGIDYIVPCNIAVREGLTIEPGVEIAFEQGASLEINDYGEWSGYINAVGTEANPIIFTGVEKVPGAWNNIFIKSADLNNKMHYTTVEYAGKTDGSEPAIEMDLDTKLEIKNSTFANNKGYALFISKSGNIEGFSNNTFTNNNNYPLHIAASMVRHLDGEQSSYQGNLHDEIYVFSNSIYEVGFLEGQDAHEWLNPGVPLFIDEVLNVGEEQFGHLRIKEGTRISFGEEFGIYVDEHNAILEIVGTEADPVILEGRDGAGSWNGIFLNTNSTQNQISNAVIKDGGQTKWLGSYDNAANLSIGKQGDNVSLILHNVSLENSAGCGLVQELDDGNGTINLTENNVSYSQNAGGDSCL